MPKAETALEVVLRAGITEILLLVDEVPGASNKPSSTTGEASTDKVPDLIPDVSTLSVDLEELVDTLRTRIRYLMLDLEATRRDKHYLLQVLNEAEEGE